MKKIYSTAIFFILIISLTSCSLNSDSKLYTAKGDAAFENRDYEMAFEHYKDAAASGKATNKVIALTEILDAYFSANEALDDDDLDAAVKIIDRLEYDYESFYPINEDMEILVKKIDNLKEDNEFINKTLKALILAIDDRNLEKAYELIADIEGYDFTEEQKEELEYQCYRIERISEKTDESSDASSEFKPESEPANPADEEQADDNSSYYRVRLSWDDVKSQLGAFKKYDGALEIVKENPGYKIFDNEGNCVYP